MVWSGFVFVLYITYSAERKMLIKNILYPSAPPVIMSNQATGIRKEQQKMLCDLNCIETVKILNKRCHHICIPVEDCQKSAGDSCQMFFSLQVFFVGLPSQSAKRATFLQLQSVRLLVCILEDMQRSALSFDTEKVSSYCQSSL